MAAYQRNHVRKLSPKPVDSSSTYNIGRLHIVLELGNLLLKIVKADLVVLNDDVDLELPDTETERNKLGSTPDEAVLLDGTDGGLESSHVSLVI